MVEDCVGSNKADWGRKCRVQRQALSDCSEEKYFPAYIPGFVALFFVWSLFACAWVVFCRLSLVSVREGGVTS
jgi:hypothetical protein